MAHIAFKEGLPGILGPLDFRPETAKPLSELAEVLLRGKSSLTPGERELIASYVSYLNQCHFCCESHSAAAKHLLGGEDQLVFKVKTNPGTASISEKMKSLLLIAKKVQANARSVTSEDIAAARKHGADDLEIHDTVLIAAAFCMYNRYVDGLATWTPQDPALYDQMGKHLAQEGYLTSSITR